MHPINFEGSNVTYKKPVGWKDEDCFDLHTLQQEDGPHGETSITSLWIPNKEDIEALVAGRGVIIRLISQVMCPISVYTIDAEGNPNV